MDEKKLTDKEVFFGLLDDISTTCGNMIEVSLLDKRYELARQLVILRHRIVEPVKFDKVGEDYCCSGCGAVVPAVLAQDYDYCPYCGQIISDKLEQENTDDNTDEDTPQTYKEPIEGN